MSWSYAYTPTIWPSILVVILMLGMAVFSARRRSVPGATLFIIGCLFGAAWGAGSLMEYAAVNLATKIFWVKFQTACQLPTATTITCFTLEYAWPGRWVNRRNLALLSIAPLLVLVMIFLDNLHHWVWTSFSFDGSVVPHLAPGGWAAIIYSFGLVILSLVVLTWLWLHSPQHRWPVALMILGHIGVRTMYVLEKINLINTLLPLDVIGLAFIVVMYSIALYAFRIFDPIPLARRTLIEQLHDGVLVLDPHGGVTSLNTAAEHILGAPLKQVQSKQIGEFLPGLSDSSSPLEDMVLSKPGEIIMGLGAESRCYELELSPLDDFRGLPVGYLLLLHDVSEQRRSQAQILEQQRGLATLKEREHLARELHDELAQGLAFINLQSQLIGSLLEAGQKEKAQAQLQVLAKAAREAQMDVRGEIGKLSYRIDPAGDLLESLRLYSLTFQEKYGVQTELISSVDFPSISFAPTVEAQLLPIVQEAFTNIRKHARANHVRVSLTKEPKCIFIEIEDDGVGFNPDERFTSHETFGQGIMSQRAAEVGGWVEVKSVPGKGTKVTIAVPVIAETL